MNKQVIVCGCLVAVTSVLAGCFDGRSPGRDIIPVASVAPTTTPGPGGLVAARSFDMTIESSAPREDGGGAVNLVVSVFVPEHMAGATYPLIVHSHGFGGSRVGLAEAAADPDMPGDVESADSIFGQIDDQVRLLWDAGYAVVSFDERGFGRGQDGDDGNDGQIQALDPNFETQDAISVLDWAEANLNITEVNGNPLVGAIGGSYGGGYQLLLTALDDRLDAITPTATWYSLLDSLVPNDVIKKGYGTGLCAVALMADPGDRVTEACRQASDTTALSRYNEDIIDGVGVTRQEILDLFSLNGMGEYERRHNDSSDSFTMRPIDALLIQGNRDILFNLEQVSSNYHFLNSLAGDVRMMTTESGHSLRQTRFLNGSQGLLGASNCGPLNAMAAIRSWFDLKLRGDSTAEANLPDEVCVSLDNNRSVELTEFPTATAAETRFDAFDVPITSTMITSANTNADDVEDGVFFGTGTTIATAGMVVAGNPVALVTVDDVAAVSVRGGPTAFVGTAIRRNDGSIILVDDQVQPLRASDPRTGATPEEIPLAGVGEVLEVGDELGVLVYGSFDQFEVTPGAPSNYATNSYTISGTVRMPVLTAATMSRN